MLSNFPSKPLLFPYCPNIPYRTAFHAFIFSLIIALDFHDFIVLHIFSRTHWTLNKWKMKTQRIWLFWLCSQRWLDCFFSFITKVTFILERTCVFLQCKRRCFCCIIFTHYQGKEDSSPSYSPYPLSQPNSSIFLQKSFLSLSMPIAYGAGEDLKPDLKEWFLSLWL